MQEHALQAVADFDPAKSLENLQTGLDVAGCVPGIGEVADAVNAGLYIGQGKWDMAACSAISILPVVGDVIGKGGKIAARADDIAGLAKSGEDLFVGCVFQRIQASCFSGIRPRISAAATLCHKSSAGVQCPTE